MKLKEILLGKSIDDVANELLDKYEFNQEFDIVPVIKEIILLKNPNLRFAVLRGDTWCDIIILNEKSDFRLDHYWDTDYEMPTLEDAHVDCKTLNEIVEEIFGIKRVKAKTKITQKQFIEKNGNICPFCLKRKIKVLDELSWGSRDIVGCTKCGEIWHRKMKKISVGFELK